MAGPTPPPRIGRYAGKSIGMAEEGQPPKKAKRRLPSRKLKPLMVGRPAPGLINR